MSRFLRLNTINIYVSLIQQSANG